MCVMGSAVWAYVISSGCGIIATLDPNGVQYRHMMDELNYFAKDKRLPREMTVCHTLAVGASRHFRVAARCPP